MKNTQKLFYPEDETRMLMELVSDMTKTYDGTDVYVPIKFEWGARKLSVKSREFRYFLSKQYYDYFKEFPSESSIKQLVSYLLGEALEHQSENPRYRINIKDGIIYYDLCSTDGCVEIHPGSWKIVKEEGNFFKQYADEKAQCTPVSDKFGLDLLSMYVNLPDNEWLLFIVYLISCFHPDIQHPILNIRGIRGSGKTTILEIIKSLVDPSYQKPISFNYSIDSLNTHLSSCYYTIFDNLSKLSKKESDTFCMVVTGGCYTKRTLYTVSDITSLNFTSLVAINGIFDVVRREDLAQRTLFFKTKPIDGCKCIDHHSFWESFEKDKPMILSDIFDILSCALEIYPKTELEEYHRMSDFDRLGYAIAESIKEGFGDKFLQAVTRNEKEQLDVIYEGTPLVQIVSGFMSDEAEWEGRTSRFYKYIKSYFRSELDDEYTDEDFPKNSAILSKQMIALNDVFKNLGIEVSIKRDRDNLSYIKLVNTRYGEEDGLEEDELQDDEEA